MKKWIVMLLLVSMLVVPIGAFAAAENIVINGEYVTIPAEMGTIREYDDRTFVPVRFVTEYLGCKVNYSDRDISATITDEANGVSYLITAGDPYLYVLPNLGSDVSGKVLLMDALPFVDDSEGRMYIPIRFLAEAMEYTVGWDEATQTVSIDAIA